jgi:heme-degrading monooxygenase HmoA
MLNLTQRVNSLVLSFALFLSVLLGLPNVADADKAPKSVVFDPSSKLVNVAAIYETTPTTQKDVVSSVMKSSKSFFKKAPGFSSFSLLKSEDGARVITLTQWQDSESYQAFVAQPAEESSKSSKKGKADKEDTTVAPNRTVLFEIDKTQAPEGIIPAIRGQAALVQFSEITAKAPDDQSKLLTSAEELLPDTAKMYPPPQSVVLLKGVDSSNMALLANWGYTATEFTDLSKAPTFEPLSEDVAALADNDQHLYEVVKVVSAKSKLKDKE